MMETFSVLERPQTKESKEIIVKNLFLEELFFRMKLINKSLETIDNKVKHDSPLLIDVKIAMRKIIANCKNFERTGEFKSISVNDEQFKEDIHHIKEFFTLIANDTMKNNIAIDNAGDIKREMKAIEDSEKGDAIKRLKEAA